MRSLALLVTAIMFVVGPSPAMAESAAMKACGQDRDCQDRVHFREQEEAERKRVAAENARKRAEARRLAAQRRAEKEREGNPEPAKLKIVEPKEPKPKNDE